MLYIVFCLLQDLRALETFIVSVLTALNPDISQDTYQEAAEDIAAFETSLAEVCVWWRGEGVMWKGEGGREVGGGVGSVFQ